MENETLLRCYLFALQGDCGLGRAWRGARTHGNGTVPMKKHRSRNPYNWGYMCAMQDDCENCQFASAGGMDKREAMEAPECVFEDQHEEYLRGYRAYCDDNYGEGWQTAKWSWGPALRIGPQTCTVSVPDGKGGWTEVE